jgi:hypothetical protein
VKGAHHTHEEKRRYKLHAQQIRTEQGRTHLPGRHVPSARKDMVPFPEDIEQLGKEQENEGRRAGP